LQQIQSAHLPIAADINESLKSGRGRPQDRLRPLLRAQRVEGQVEFLFLDGGSRDRTLAILEELARRGPVPASPAASAPPTSLSTSSPTK
jgi:hypothetical protein